ncbi:N-formylglutamate amidohydrolase [Qingshengfaniella alkalisoli]|uniref:N-formylglutamate amidohydrolase n=1 Tax=Qingshengfaniella alkalisoli TaxID=2599296 RepID=UPI001F1103CF|nr:N-formylglutamate amidohydrolase [Qingshengfaniella alkalisoli]
MAYKIVRPENAQSCVVFASPHSGRRYDPAFLESTILDEHSIRSSEDAYMDQLIEDAPLFGAPLLLACMPRAYIDLNRASDELDPALVAGIRRAGHNPRVSSGLGVIPRVVANGKAIYRGKITRDEALARIDTVWHPYHRALAGLIDEQRQKFGQSILIDCHSMPHEAIENHSSGGAPPQVVLGDRFGAAASPEIMDAVEAAFQQEGLRVARNTPFAGAYVTQTYGRPVRNQHVIQMELDRALYMDERRVCPNADFQEVRQMIGRVIARIAEFGQGALPLAAE